MSQSKSIDQSELNELLQDNARLYDIEISGLEFDPEQLEELIAEKVTFRNCRWVECDFTGARFKDCHFVDCQFLSSLMGEVTFDSCVFFDAASGTSVDFSFANLRESKFLNCNLSASRFVGADLYDVTIKDCKVSGSDFGTATFSRKFGRAQTITRASLQSSIFDDCNLSNLDLEGCNLVCSSFRHADLSSAILTEADMGECDLSNAQILRANFERTDLRGAQLEGFSIGLLSGFEGIRISASEQQTILVHLGIRVSP